MKITSEIKSKIVKHIINAFDKCYDPTQSVYEIHLEGDYLTNDYVVDAIAEIFISPEYSCCDLTFLAIFPKGGENTDNLFLMLCDDDEQSSTVSYINDEVKSYLDSDYEF